MNCGISILLAGICLWEAGAAAWGETAPGAVTVALVTSQGKHASVLPVAALAEAQLSKEAGIVLVDRARIETILTEQELSGGALVDAASAVKLGRLLKADLFAVVEADAANGKSAVKNTPRENPSPTALVVFDVVTGCRYWDAPLPEDLEAAASAIVLGVRQAIEKSRDSSGELRTICLLPVRNVALPRELDAFCEMIGMFVADASQRQSDDGDCITFTTRSFPLAARKLAA